MPAMWDRFRTAGAASHQHRLGPQADEKSASGAGVPFGYTYQIKGGPPPPRPPRDLPEEHLFANYPQPQPQPQPRDANRDTLGTPSFRPASSVYTQPSPLDTGYPAHVHTTRSPPPRRRDSDVSPPSSPEALTPRDGLYRSVSPDISPVDDEPPTRAMSHLDIAGPRQASGGQRQAPGAARTNIPMMRRERRKMSDAALREKDSLDRLRHHEQPGAPTSPQAPRNGPSPTSFGDRVRAVGRKPSREAASETDPAARAFSASRPAWHGASGRTTLVAPVYDKPDVAPLRIPPKSSRRAASPPSQPPPPASGGGLDARVAGSPASPRGAEPASRPGGAPGAVRKTGPAAASSATPNPSARRRDSAIDSLPSQTGARAAATTAAAARAAATTAAAATALPGLTNSGAQIRRKPPPATHPQPEMADHPALQAGGSAGGESPWVQPGSRFSVTTYAPSEPSTTPRPSADGFAPDDHPPPLPAPPEQDGPGGRGASPPPPPSVMDRQRPKLRSRASAGSDWSADREPIKISLGQPWMSTPYSTSQSASGQRRATDSSVSLALSLARSQQSPTAGTGHGQRDPDPSRRRDSLLSLNKSLPAPPPEASAASSKDRVALLNARLRSVGNRRINLTRSIHQMTELMPTDNLLDSAEVVAKRDAERRKVEELRLELAECQREEYELGLKLHRAYKRMDREAQFEPTSLWVKRVAG